MAFKFNESTASEFIKESDNTFQQKCDRSKRLSDPAMYDELKTSLKAIAGRTFPDFTIEVFFFGSRMMGLADDNSVLDIFINIGDNYDSNFTFDLHQLKKLHKLGAVLDKDRSWRFHKSVERGNVPTIILKYLPMKLNCKYCFSQLFHVLSTQYSELNCNFFQAKLISTTAFPLRTPS